MLQSSLWEDFKGFFGEILDVDELKDWDMKVEKIEMHPQWDLDSEWLQTLL